MTIILAEGGEKVGFLLEWLERFADSPFLMGVVLALATLVSEDLTCISGGILAANGLMPFGGATLACAIGIWMGDVGLYGLGWIAGRSKVNWRWLDRLVSPERVLRGRRLFERHGVKWVFLSRFLPGTRLPSYVAAGVVGWSFRTFALSLVIAAVVWTPILCGLAFFAGRIVLEWVETYQKWAWPILLGTIAVLFVVIRLILPMFSWKGRRMLVGRWMRVTRWEFWPVWAVYPPVVLVLAWQAIRLRGVLLFTCCNPSMPHSGFAMESKGDILDALQCPDEDRIRIARYRRLRVDAGAEVSRLDEVRAFMRDAVLEFPVVLKPDIGERGQGVAVIRDEDAARRWLDACAGPALVQEYIGGEEYGVAWSRGPAEDCGEVSSVIIPVKLPYT